MAREAKQRGQPPWVAMAYDELIRKQMADQAEKNDPTFQPNNAKLHRVDREVLARADRECTQRVQNNGFKDTKGKGKGKYDGKANGKAEGKGGFSYGKGKEHGKGDNRQNNYDGQQDRGEKRLMPWQKPYYDNNKKWKGGGSDSDNKLKDTRSDGIAYKSPPIEQNKTAERAADATPTQGCGTCD